ncbi:hypothetical protein GCM10025734_04690 [Kitasatospora paranensis]
MAPLTQEYAAGAQLVPELSVRAGVCTLFLTSAATASGPVHTPLHSTGWAGLTVSV